MRLETDYSQNKTRSEVDSETFTASSKCLLMFRANIKTNNTQTGHREYYPSCQIRTERGRRQGSKVRLKNSRSDVHSLKCLSLNKQEKLTVPKIASNTVSKIVI